jgi:NADH-quinone oxidoreductase subunit J
MDAAVFYVSGLISLAASLLVVTRRNPVYGAIFLVLFFTMISLDFLILRAPFLAVIQVLVYAGAIMVLYLFVIMLLSLKPEELREEVTAGRKLFAGLFSGGLFFLLVYGVHLSPRVQGATDLAGPVAAGAAGLGTTAAVGEELFTRQVLPFEVTSILILIAIIGAVYLTRKRTDGPEGAGSPAALRAEPPADPSGESRAGGPQAGPTTFIRPGTEAALATHPGGGKDRS